MSKILQKIEAHLSAGDDGTYSHELLTELIGTMELDIQADIVLKAAFEEMKGAIVIGYDNNDELYFASSYAGRGKILWLLEQAKQVLMSTSNSDETKP